jgi:glycosyltransferase involved in cell wall biosynthesis
MVFVDDGSTDRSRAILADLSRSDPAVRVVIATAATNPDSAGWDHVSVSVSDRGGIYNCALPTWQEMSMIKDLFWDEEECVIQFHPPKSQYVNNYNALHLWKPAQREIPQPPTWLIGTVK